MRNRGGRVRDLRPVEQLQPPAALAGGPGRASLQLAEGAVELPASGSGLSCFANSASTWSSSRCEPAARLRRDRDHGRPLPQPPVQEPLRLLQVDLGDVPLREDDERRAAGLARHVRDGEVLLDHALATRRRARARRRPARPPRAPGARSSTRSPAAACACGAGRPCRRARRSSRPGAARCRSRRASSRAPRRRSRARVRAARSGATTCRRSGGRGSRPGSPRRRPAPRPSPGRRATISSSRSPVPWPCSAESGTGSPSPSRWNSTASRSRRGSSILLASTMHGLVREARRIVASSSSPGVMPARASTTKSTRSASSTAARACCGDLAARTGPLPASSTPPVSTSRNLCRSTRRGAPCGRA